MAAHDGVGRRTAGILFLVVVWAWAVGCSAGGRGDMLVVVYTSMDQVFAERVFDEFEQASGIRVLAVYDTEATKTVGLVNRIISEKENPRADVFWNNEVFNTLRLKKAGLLEPHVSANSRTIPDKFKDPDGCWTGFAARLRVIVYNTENVAPDDVPRSVFDLVEPEWQNRVAIAYPQFGTTLGHMGSLLVTMGEEKFKTYADALKANGVRLCDGNSQVCDLVARGVVRVGLTDSDDVYVRRRRGRPVEMVIPDQDGIGTLVIPNTVMLVKGARHPVAGRRLIDFLLSLDVERMLAESDSSNIPVRSEVARSGNIPRLDEITEMKVSYEAVSERMQEAGRTVSDIFAR